MFTQNLIHASFSVDDISTAKSFYCDTLGFELVKEYADAQMILLEAGGGTKINIYQKDTHTPWDSTVLGIEVDDVGRAIEQLAVKGIAVENVEGTDESGISSLPGGGEAAESGYI